MWRARAPARRLVLVACSAAWIGCSVDPTANPAYDKACPSGARMYRHFCVDAGPSDRSRLDSAVEDAADGAVGRGTPSGAPKPAAGAAASGGESGDAGANGKEAGSSARRDASAASSTPPDSPGQTCVGQALPQRESCNGADDDCDGRVDEDSELPCIEANDGCVQARDGTFSCKGACRAGVKRCLNGVLDSACTGQVLPGDHELCGTIPAIDDDCDGSTDETCACAAGEMQECYDGPLSTRDVGMCRHGTQTCSEGAFEPCMNEVVPVPETCMNEGQDDDCNRVEDDIPNRGNPCTAAAQGLCRSGSMQCDSGELRCQPAGPGAETCNTLDDDCDGMVDEGLLEDDPNNCGQCGRRCDPGQVCCAAQCVDTATDSLHCGACDHACPQTAASCCGGHCIDIDADANHCGTCAHACGGGDMCCDGTCVSAIADDHCGSCTNVCSSLQTCCPTGTCGILDALGVCL